MIDSPLVTNGRRQLMVDDQAISSRRGLKRIYHPATTEQEPVITGDMPWEGRRVYCFGSARRDALTGRVRLWYLARMGEGANGLYEGGEQHGDAVLYAESDDGVHFERPELDRYPVSGKPSNIVLPGHHAPTLFDPPDGSGIWLAAWSWHRKGYVTYRSKDGLTFEPVEPAGRPMFDSGDRTLEVISVDRNIETGRYHAFHRTWDERSWPPRRVISARTSDDGRTWSDSRPVIMPDAIDEADPSLADAPPGLGAEFYTLSGFWYESQFLGLLPVFRMHTYRNPDDPAYEDPGAGPGVVSSWDGPLDVQMVSSRDGWSWSRSSPRTWVLPRGPAGRHDGGSILSTADKPVVTDTEILVYYTALTTTHGAPMPPKEVSVGLARWRRDGFTSLAAEAVGGYLQTVPVEARGRPLYVNADVRDGRLETEIVGLDGRPLPGYGRGDCRPLTGGNELDWRVEWRDNRELPVEPLRIRFWITSGHLFSYRLG